MNTLGRNDPCSCGSGKKYKQCCLQHRKVVTANARLDKASIAQALQSATQHHAAGRLVDAEVIYRQILKVAPKHLDVLFLQGLVSYQLGKYDIAIEFLGKAIQGNPSSPEYYEYLGNALEAKGDFDAAVESYEKVLSINPAQVNVHCNLGKVFKAQGKLAEAIEHCRIALLLEPNLAEAHSNLGNALNEQGALDAAIEHYHQALSLKPDFADAHYNLATILQKQGKLVAAIEHYGKALKLKPDWADAFYKLGSIIHDQNINLAIEYYRKALSFKPDYVEVHISMGRAYKEIGDSCEAIKCYQQALSLQANCADAYVGLANVFSDLGQSLDAREALSRAQEIKPDSVDVHSALLFCLTHCETTDAKMLLFEHCQFGKQFETPFLANRPAHSNSRNPERTLQIGFVSGDLCNHAVAHFIEPVLVHLSSYPRLSLHAYSNHILEDAVTQRLQEYFTHWHCIVGLSDEALTEKIRADNIDILIDLSGHTDRHRLLVFARKPAPVQASWIGYPCTTGLQSMDYYISDRFCLPNEEFRGQFAEKIVYLPAVAPFLPSKETPPVNTLPALSNGYVTFGSFNRPNKLSPLVIATWSQLLRALPESKMVLGAIPQCDTLVSWFAREGIVRERLSFHQRCDLETYLTLHHQIDICLDTFPYNGGTTTNHALWMGVPVLTMAGGIPSGRVGATLLSHVGLDEFIAYGEEDFVKKGLDRAKDIDALALIRTGLRARFEQAAIGQPALIANRLERAFRIMLQRWCDGLSPADLDVSDN